MTDTAPKHGGARPGAGRKPRPQGRYDTAYDFLVAVARGVEQASPEQRVAAARAVLPYERPKTRAPRASPRPAELRAQEVVRDEADDAGAWHERAVRIRAKHHRRTK